MESSPVFLQREVKIVRAWHIAQDWWKVLLTPQAAVCLKRSIYTEHVSGTLDTIHKNILEWKNFAELAIFTFRGSAPDHETLVEDLDAAARFCEAVKRDPSSFLVKPSPPDVPREAPQVPMSQDPTNSPPLPSFQKEGIAIIQTTPGWWSYDVDFIGGYPPRRVSNHGSCLARTLRRYLSDQEYLLARSSNADAVHTRDAFLKAIRFLEDQETPEGGGGKKNQDAEPTPSDAEPSIPPEGGSGKEDANTSSPEAKEFREEGAVQIRPLYDNHAGEERTEDVPRGTQEGGEDANTRSPEPFNEGGLSITPYLHLWTVTTTPSLQERLTGLGFQQVNPLAVPKEDVLKLLLSWEDKCSKLWTTVSREWLVSFTNTLEKAVEFCKRGAAPLKPQDTRSPSQRREDMKKKWEEVQTVAADYPHPTPEPPNSFFQRGIHVHTMLPPDRISWSYSISDGVADLLKVPINLRARTGISRKQVRKYLNDIYNRAPVGTTSSSEGGLALHEDLNMARSNVLRAITFCDPVAGSFPLEEGEKEDATTVFSRSGILIQTTLPPRATSWSFSIGSYTAGLLHIPSGLRACTGISKQAVRRHLDEILRLAPVPSSFQGDPHDISLSIVRNALLDACTFCSSPEEGGEKEDETGTPSQQREVQTKKGWEEMKAVATDYLKERLAEPQRFNTPLPSLQDVKPQEPAVLSTKEILGREETFFVPVRQPATPKPQSSQPLGGAEDPDRASFRAKLLAGIEDAHRLMARGEEKDHHFSGKKDPSSGLFSGSGSGPDLPPGLPPADLPPPAEPASSPPSSPAGDPPSGNMGGAKIGFSAADPLVAQADYSFEMLLGLARTELARILLHPDVSMPDDVRRHFTEKSTEIRCAYARKLKPSCPLCSSMQVGFRNDRKWSPGKADFYCQSCGHPWTGTAPAGEHVVAGSNSKFDLSGMTPSEKQVGAALGVPPGTLAHDPVSTNAEGVSAGFEAWMKPVIEDPASYNKQGPLPPEVPTAVEEMARGAEEKALSKARPPCPKCSSSDVGIQKAAKWHPHRTDLVCQTCGNLWSTDAMSKRYSAKAIRHDWYSTVRIGRSASGEAVVVPPDSGANTSSSEDAPKTKAWIHLQNPDGSTEMVGSRQMDIDWSSGSNAPDVYYGNPKKRRAMREAAAQGSSPLPPPSTKTEVAETRPAGMWKKVEFVSKDGTRTDVTDSLATPTAVELMKEQEALAASMLGPSSSRVKPPSNLDGLQKALKNYGFRTPLPAPEENPPVEYGDSKLKPLTLQLLANLEKKLPTVEESKPLDLSKEEDLVRVLNDASLSMSKKERAFLEEVYKSLRRERLGLPSTEDMIRDAVEFLKRNPVEEVALPEPEALDSDILFSANVVAAAKRERQARIETSFLEKDLRHLFDEFLNTGGVVSVEDRLLPAFYGSRKALEFWTWMGEDHVRRFVVEYLKEGNTLWPGTPVGEFVISEDGRSLVRPKTPSIPVPPPQDEHAFAPSADLPPLPNTPPVLPPVAPTQRLRIPSDVMNEPVLNKLDTMRNQILSGQVRVLSISRETTGRGTTLSISYTHLPGQGDSSETHICAPESQVSTSSQPHEPNLGGSVAEEDAISRKTSNGSKVEGFSWDAPWVPEGDG